MIVAVVIIIAKRWLVILSFLSVVYWSKNGRGGKENYEIGVGLSCPVEQEKNVIFEAREFENEKKFWKIKIKQDKWNVTYHCWAVNLDQTIV